MLCGGGWGKGLQEPSILRGSLNKLNLDFRRGGVVESEHKNIPLKGMWIHKLILWDLQCKSNALYPFTPDSVKCMVQQLSVEWSLFRVLSIESKVR